MNSSIKLEEGFKKKVGQYFISFCQAENYGKSLHGQMRAGYQQSTKKVFIFRINPLPLSSSMQNFLNLQHIFSQLKQYARIVKEDVNSSSFNYTVLEFFPKTFQTEINNFRKTPKYFDQMVEKFLKTYSFFYNMNLSHGNLIPSNIGITFDGKIKLMDFQCLPQQISKLNIQDDFDNFKAFVSRVLQKNNNYPYKFEVFNGTQDNQTWQHLFGSWHITSPLEPVYLSRKNNVQNMVTSLYKLQSSLEDIYEKHENCQNSSQLSSNSLNQSLGESVSNQAGKIKSITIEQRQVSQKQISLVFSQIQKLNDLKMAIRLLQLSYLVKSKQEKLQREAQALEQIIEPLSEHDLDYYNSVLMGAIKDYQYYLIDPSRRLLLMSCLIPNLNHQYIFYQIVQQFKENSQNKERNLLLGDSLFSKFKNNIFQNLLKKPKTKFLL